MRDPCFPRVDAVFIPCQQTRRRRHGEVAPLAQAHGHIGGVGGPERLVFPSDHVVLDWAGPAGLGSGDRRVREQRELPTFLFLFQKTKSFTRVVDGVFFPDEPLELLTRKAFNSVPSIIGVNNHECGFLLPVVRTPRGRLGSLPGQRGRGSSLHGSLPWMWGCAGWSLSAQYRAVISPLSDGGRQAWGQP